MLRVILFSPNGYVGSCIKAKMSNQQGMELFEITRESNLDLIEGNYDIFIYSASITSARKANAEQYISDNALCAATMMEFCKKHLVKRIVYLSSDEIYGQIYTEQVSEDAIMHEPNIYATTKYLAEKIIMESGIGYYILRLPGIVGRQWGSSFLCRLIDKISENEQVSICNADKAFNNVVDIDDLVDFIIMLAFRDDYEKSEVFLLGNTCKLRLSELVDYIKQMCSSTSEIIHMRERGSRYFTLNVEKAVNYGYESKDMKEIINELCQCRQG